MKLPGGKCDRLIISKTPGSTQTLYDDSIIIPATSRYTWYTLNRQATGSNQRRAGGVAIIVERNLAHKVIKAPPTKLLEVIELQLATNRGPIEILSAYLPGGATTEEINSHYKSDLRLLTQRSTSVFIFGDLNSKHRSWNCNRANTAGNILFNEQQRQNFIVFFLNSPLTFPMPLMPRHPRLTCCFITALIKSLS